MAKNKCLIAAAGAGKTTYIVNEALTKTKRVLMVTFTENNRDEIVRKVVERRGYIPSNITITTWFTFLIQHGVKPLQSCFHSSFAEVKFRGLILCKTGKEGKKLIRSKGKTQWVPIKSEGDSPLEHYSSKDGRLYSDRLSKLVFKIGNASKKDFIKEYLLCSLTFI